MLSAFRLPVQWDRIFCRKRFHRLGKTQKEEEVYDVRFCEAMYLTYQRDGILLSKLSNTVYTVREGGRWFNR